ncbi:MAG: hypothetical protein OEM28_09450 [Nitrosopumilus sp.]|nr:hypothetical protein [Nitrosopumilus sp.]MDH3488507.1 hypothetical protein [Nitrosopumilus sp.]
MSVSVGMMSTRCVWLFSPGANRSPGPVFCGCTPSSVWKLMYALPCSNSWARAASVFTVHSEASSCPSDHDAY